MGLIARLLHRPDGREAQSSTPAESSTCPHIALVPRWNNLDDMGHAERASGYHCEACGEDFSGAEGRELLTSAGERVRLSDGANSLN